MLYQNLRNNLFAVIPYPREIQDAVAETMRLWESFCGLPTETKELFIYPDHQKYDIGYKIREKKKGREDKEYFHLVAYNSIFANMYPEAKKAIANNAVIHNFFESAERLHRTISGKMVQNIVYQLEEESGGVLDGLREEIFPFIGMQSIRFLHYTPAEDVEVVGGEHYDRSGFSLHLYESGPGLEFLPLSEKGKKVEDMRWIEAPMAPDHTVVFTGYQISRMSNNDLKHTWHRVRPKEKTHRERFSAVMFNALSTVPSYDENERSQELVPGYGY